MDQLTIVGRVLRSSTTSFTVGCRQLISEQDQLIPEFGALVRADAKGGSVIYGLIYNVTIEDDAFVRQLVAAGVESPEIIEDQRQKRQVPVVVDVLVAGSGRGLEVYHRLPAQPPSTLDQIYLCNPGRDRALHRAARLAAHRPGLGRSARRSALDRGAAQRRAGPPAGSKGRLPYRRGTRAGEAAGVGFDAVGRDFSPVTRPLRANVLRDT